MVAIVFAAMMYGVAYWMPTLTIAIPQSTVLVPALGLLGAAVALSGFIAFGRHKTTINPLNPNASTALVTDGIYRVSRNPMYLGLALALAGWAVYLSHVAAVLLWPGFIVYMNRFQIQPEEHILRAKFGAPFEQYLLRVRRWI